MFSCVFVGRRAEWVIVGKAELNEKAKTHLETYDLISFT